MLVALAGLAVLGGVEFDERAFGAPRAKRPIDMIVAVAPSLSAFIAARIAGYASEPTEPFHRAESPSVTEHRALPLIRHWFETYGIRADGEIVRWSTTDCPEPYLGTKPIEDRYDWLSALVEGSRRYPELKVLLPERSPEAVDCACVGRPHFAPGKAICPECCGLDWVARGS